MELIWGKSMEEKQRAEKNMNHGGERERERERDRERDVDNFFFFGLEIGLECYK